MDIFAKQQRHCPPCLCFLPVLVLRFGPCPGQTAGTAMLHPCLPNIAGDTPGLLQRQPLLLPRALLPLLLLSPLLLLRLLLLVLLLLRTLTGFGP
jgi:hypothetical protein